MLGIGELCLVMGRAAEMSKDHEPNCKYERLRIENLGNVIYDGYLDG